MNAFSRRYLLRNYHHLAAILLLGVDLVRMPIQLICFWWGIRGSGTPCRVVDESHSLQCEVFRLKIRRAEFMSAERKAGVWRANAVNLLLILILGVVPFELRWIFYFPGMNEILMRDVSGPSQQSASLLWRTGYLPFVNCFCTSAILQPFSFETGRFAKLIVIQSPGFL